MKKIIFILTLYACQSQAQAPNWYVPPRLPTDVELKATYCIAVIKELLAVMGSDKAPSQLIQDSIKNSSNDLRRLQLYILPRTTDIEPISLLAAVEAGQSDVRQSTENTRTCNARFNQIPQDQYQKCMFGNPVDAKIRSCYGAAFLPF